MILSWLNITTHSSFSWLFIFCFFAYLPISLISQDESAKQWYKGNLHTHSYWSDGDDFPERIMEWYKSNGYHFLALTDHNTLAQGEKWVNIAVGSIHHQAFLSYLKQYGEDWVNYRVDSGKVAVQLKTLDEYRPLFEEEGKFLIMQGEEITDGFDGAPIHLNSTNLIELIEPQGGNSVVEVLQRNIDAVNAQREKTGQPMIVHINHPNFHYAISANDMKQLKGERFFEVFNGHPAVHNMGDSLHSSIESMWDEINITYYDQDQALLLGIATDDSHNYHLLGEQWSNSGRGWVMVRAGDLTPEALIQALESSDFYSSTGVEFRELHYGENSISLAIQEQEGVEYEIQFIGYLEGQSNTTLLHSVKGGEASYTAEEGVLFFRAKVLSNQPMPLPLQEVQFASAWTQPVLVR